MSGVDRWQDAEEEVEQARQEKETQAWESLREEPLDQPGERSSVELQIKDIHTSNNIRPDLPDLLPLAQSIHERGLLHPPLVSFDGEGYNLVAGARRLAALEKLYGDEYQLVCETVQTSDEAERVAMMLVENEQRVRLEPLVAARGLRAIMQAREHASAAACARSLGLNARWVQERLRLLDLPQGVQERLDRGDLSFTVADLLRKQLDGGNIDSDQAETLAESVATGEQSAGDLKTQFSPASPPSEDEFESSGPSKFKEVLEEDNLETMADDLIAGSSSEEEPAAGLPADWPTRSLSLALCQILSLDEQWALKQGIEDVWTHIPSLSLRERQELLEGWATDRWKDQPERFRALFG